MKCIKKILLSFLILVYVTHVYSRLVYTPPIYVTASSKSEQTIDENEKNAAKKSFILHRRHLPLTKKIEISKLFPHLNVCNYSGSIEEKSIKVFIPQNGTVESISIHYPSNKAPPVFC